MLSASARATFLSLLFASSLAGQDIPQEVRDAVDVRHEFCNEIQDPQRDSLSFYPGLEIFVSRCETYFGTGETVAVALDRDGVLYLLDSPSSFHLLEKRLGQPVVDSTDIVEYAVVAAKLSGSVSWDSRLQTDTIPSPDPRTVADVYPTEGECVPTSPPRVRRYGSTTIVYFHVATEWWVGSVEFMQAGPNIFVESETLCQAMHSN